MERAPTPFPGLPAGEVTPWPGPGSPSETLARDIATVRWFVEKRWSRRIDPSTPLGELLAASEKADLTAAHPSIEDLPSDRAVHYLHATAGLMRLAWAIRALHGCGDAVENVHASFIDKELMGGDTKEKNAQRLLPGGIGTIIFAARLVQAGGGKIIAINGNGVRGHDIRWRTSYGDVVLIERKDRAFEAGLGDTHRNRADRLVSEVRSAAAKMPIEEGTVRILTVGFHSLVRPHDAERVEGLYTRTLKRAFPPGPSRRGLPHLVVAEHLGLEARTKGFKIDFFSPQPLNDEPEDLVLRVGRLLLRALGTSDC